VILLLAAKTSVMGAYAAGRTPLALGWIATGLMGVTACTMLLPG
jgi:hypothetical protein